MGYTLRIGELEVEIETDEECPRIGLSAKDVRHEKAPAYGEPTDFENQRWPSYGSWSDFCEFSGLYDLFFGKRGDAIIASHPDCVPLTEKHRKEVNDAYEAFKTKYPNATPTYGDNQCPLGIDKTNPEENGQMCRLEWLKYWVNWALDNCERPVFENN